MPEDLSHLRAHYDDLFDFDNQALLIRVPPSVEAVLFDEPSMTGNSLKIRLLAAGTNEVRTPRSRRSVGRASWFSARVSTNIHTGTSQSVNSTEKCPR